MFEPGAGWQGGHPNQDYGFDQYPEAHNGPYSNNNFSPDPTPHLANYSSEADTGPSGMDLLKQAAINDRLTELQSRLADEKEIIPGMISTGTVTLVYSPPGAGKTVWMLGSLFAAIKAGRIKGSDVIYFNEDDGSRGMIQKGVMGSQHSINMITLSESKVPGLRTRADALRLMYRMAETGEAKDKIVTIDTLKKFGGVLAKAEMKEVLDVFRAFATAGGTVICLGHCNKHRTLDGRLVFEGVGDLKSDVDNMFGLDPLNDKFALHQELLVINEKDRNQISFEGGFRYRQTGQLTDYKESVGSVEFLTTDDIDDLKKKMKGQVNVGKALAKYEDEFIFLQSNLANGISMCQSDLMSLLSDDELNPNSCTRKMLRNCIDLLKGHHLELTRRGAHGKKFYRWINS